MISGISAAILATETSLKLTVFSACNDSTGSFLLGPLCRDVRSSNGLGSVARTFFGNCFVEYLSIQNKEIEKN